jgi:hypothetical protein
VSMVSDPRRPLNPQVTKGSSSNSKYSSFISLIVLDDVCQYCCGMHRFYLWESPLMARVSSLISVIHTIWKSHSVAFREVEHAFQENNKSNLVTINDSKDVQLLVGGESYKLFIYTIESLNLFQPNI